MTDRPVRTGGSASTPPGRRAARAEASGAGSSRGGASGGGPSRAEASPGAEGSPRREARQARRARQRAREQEAPRADTAGEATRSHPASPTGWTQDVEDDAPPPRDVLDIDLGGLRLHLPVLPTAWLLIAVGVLLTGARLARGWYWQDDFALLAGAADQPLGLGLLTTGYNGHLIPGTWLIAWFVDHVAPLRWWPAALSTLLFTTAIDVAALALFRRLFGTRPAILLPLALVCTSSLTVMPSLWWAAAMQWLPVTFSLAAGLYFHAGYLRTGRARDAAGAVLSVAVGLLFFEKALTTVVVLALFTVAYGVSGPWLRRPVAAFVRHWRYWLAHAGVAVVFLAVYLPKVEKASHPARNAGELWTMVRYQLLDTVIPAFVGGPLRWLSTPGNINGWPHPPILLSVLAWALAVVAVVASVRLRRGAWRAWVLFGVFYAISAGLVAQARLGWIGPFIGRDERYVADLVVMLPFCLALAWLPLRGGLDRGRGTAAPERDDPLSGDSRLAAAGAVVTVLAVAGFVVSGETFMAGWSKNPSKEYFSNLADGLAAGNVSLVPDTQVPEGIMTSAFGADRTLDRLAPMFPDPPRIADHADAAMMPDERGRLHPVTVRGLAAVVTQPAACGTPGRDATVLLPAPANGFGFTVKLGYLAQADGTARVGVGDATPVTVPLHRGLHETYVFLPRVGGGPVVTLAGLTASVCIGSAAVGQAFAG